MNLKVRVYSRHAIPAASSTTNINYKRKRKRTKAEVIEDTMVKVAYAISE